MGAIVTFPLSEAQVEYARMNRLYRAELERIDELHRRTGKLHKTNPRIVRAYFRARWMVEYGRPTLFEE
jgi:hypothetical protein